MAPFSLALALRKETPLNLQPRSCPDSWERVMEVLLCASGQRSVTLMFLY